MSSLGPLWVSHAAGQLQSETERGPVSLVGAATSIIFVATDTNMIVFVATNACLWRQNTYFVFRAKSMLVATKVLSRQNYVCHD